MKITSISIKNAVDKIYSFYEIDLSKQTTREEFKLAILHLLFTVNEFNSNEFKEVDLISHDFHSENFRKIFSGNYFPKDSYKETVDFLVKESLLIEIPLRKEYATLADFKTAAERNKRKKAAETKF